MRRTTFLVLALVCAAVSGCGDNADRRHPSRPQTSEAEVVLMLSEKLAVWTDQLPGVYMFSGGRHQIRGTCVISFDQSEAQQGGVDVVSPDGRLRIHVTNPYTMETHGAVPLSVCLQTVRETLKW
jgi:hypothetical protein